MALSKEITHGGIEPIHSAYGPIALDDPLVAELIASAPFQRLKEIHQYGVVHYIQPTEAYSRFEHSLGVYWLLQKINASREEQISGLLHDVSHTVFSHVGDYVYKKQYNATSYQDDIHLWFLKESGLSAILQKHGISTEQICHRNPQFNALDQPLPHLCADRLEYNMQGGLLRNLLTQNEFTALHHALSFKDGNWIVEDLSLAEKLGRSSLIMTETLWGAAWEALAYRFAAEALKRAFEINLVTFDEFHFSTDTVVWAKLSSSNDDRIRKKIEWMQNIHDSFTLTEHGKEDLLIKLKFRGLDPLVHTANGVQPLTSISKSYSAEYEQVKDKMAQGWPVKLHSEIDLNID